MNDADEDSLDFDITISGSVNSATDPLTPPPTIRKSFSHRIQKRLAVLAVIIFVVFLAISIILVLVSMHRI
ncbi:unnamed protein product [Caenorhabditis bovis]|uniref:Uncharacterized protein n=1 Tax=Caenorhabditis bovis TaxID=2654633 RepID=A0A8S1EDL0_9PELO|nr:unnamed protein product [Caenorhabditis bovis]